MTLTLPGLANTAFSSLQGIVDASPVLAAMPFPARTLIAALYFFALPALAAPAAPPALAPAQRAAVAISPGRPVIGFPATRPPPTAPAVRPAPVVVTKKP